jgi:uncharacterized membrane protein
MLLLVAGLIIFFAVHLLPTVPDLRAGLRDRFGATPYQIAFSALSLVGFALIVIGYHKLQLLAGKNPQLWVPPAWTKHIAFALMLPAMIFLVAAYVPSRIRTALKHPMLLAIKIWALAHLIANGTLGALVLFLSFLAFAVYDRISVKKRAAAGQHGAGAGPLGVATGGIGGDITVLVAGTALYAFMLLYGHQALINKALIAFRIGS